MNDSFEMALAPKMAGLAQELRPRYRDRVVTYDMPPGLAQDEPGMMPHVDAALPVVRMAPIRLTTADQPDRDLRYG
jgi:hypothetical protein